MEATMEANVAVNENNYRNEISNKIRITKLQFVAEGLLVGTKNNFTKTIFLVTLIAKVLAIVTQLIIFFLFVNKYFSDKLDYANQIIVNQYFYILVITGIIAFFIFILLGLIKPEVMKLIPHSAIQKLYIHESEHANKIYISVHSYKRVFYMSLYISDFKNDINYNCLSKVHQELIQSNSGKVFITWENQWS